MFNFCWTRYISVASNWTYNRRLTIRIDVNGGIVKLVFPCSIYSKVMYIL